MTQSTIAPWNTRLAVITEFRLPNDVAATVFNTTVSEIQTARRFVEEGIIKLPTLSPSEQDHYSNLLRNVPHSTGSALGPFHKPQNSTSKVVQALNSVTTTPQPIDGIISRYGVSKAVLRQGKRFLGQPVKISIRRDPATGVEMISRCG